MRIKVKNIIPEFVDERGFISRIVNASPYPLSSILYINRKKGVITANHYHKKDAHYIYCLSGKLRYYEKEVQKKNGKLHSVVMNPGDIVLSKPMIAHATEFLEDSVILAFTTEGRNQKNYEKDTVRIKIA